MSFDAVRADVDFMGHRAYNPAAPVNPTDIVRLQDVPFGADPGYTVVTRATGAGPSAFNLGGLGSGLLKQAVALGVATLSIAAANTDFPDVSAHYLVDRAAGAPPNAQNIGLLTTGLGKWTIASGVATLSTAVVNTDYPDPAGAYLVARAAGAPTNGVNLGALSTGIPKLTVSGGVATVSIATANTDYASATAQYIVATATGAPPSSQNIGALASGILMNSVSGGVGTLSAAVSNTDFADPGAYYVVLRSTAAPANSQNLGALTTGLVKSTVSGSNATLSIAASGTDFQAPLSAANGTIVFPTAATVRVGVLPSAFIVQGTADASLSGAQFLGALGTGLLKNTTTTGVLSVAVANTDYADPTARYVVRSATGAPANAQNIGALTQGVLQQTVSGGLATIASVVVPALLVPFGAASGGGLATSADLAFIAGATPFLQLGSPHGLGGQLSPGQATFSINGSSASDNCVIQQMSGNHTSTNFVSWQMMTEYGIVGAQAAISLNGPLNTANRGANDLAIATFTQLGSNTVPGHIWFQAFDGVAATRTDICTMRSDGGVVLWNTSAAVSPASSSALRTNANKLQLSENGGAWTNFTDLGGANAYMLVARATGAPTNAINLGALGSGFVKSTVSGGIATISIDGSTYLTTAAAASTYQPILTAGTGITIVGSVISSSVSGGADASGYYVVTRGTSAPANATNLGALASGLLKSSVSGGVSTLSIAASGTDYQAPLSAADSTIVFPTAATVRVGTLPQKFVAGGTADATLSGAQFLGNLSSGIVKNAATTGTLSIAVANTDYAHPGATYVVSSSASAPGSAQNLGALTTGLLKHTVSGGVSTIATAVAGTDYQAPLVAGSGISIVGTTISATASGGAPAGSFYLVNQATSAPANAINLGALTTGILKQTVSGGVATMSIAAANTDFPSVSATYLVTSGTAIPPNGFNLASLGNGFLKQAVSGGVATMSVDNSTYLTTAAAASTYQPILTAGSRITIVGTTISAADTRVAASGTDAIPDNLQNKLGSAGSLTITRKNPGGNEFLELSVPSSLPPNGTASGDLGNVYPNPTVVALHEGGGARLTFGAIADGNVLQRSGSSVAGVYHEYFTEVHTFLSTTQSGDGNDGWWLTFTNASVTPSQSEFANSLGLTATRARLYVTVLFNGLAGGTLDIVGTKNGGALGIGISLTGSSSGTLSASQSISLASGDTFGLRIATTVATNGSLYLSIVLRLIA